ncbi:MAG: hypothetical protein CGU28_04915 [Candidatus Dactylopiibacterium carminicum]|uniref:N-acyl amino acid synthase FeeM catalytic core domain-containing protein n=1 Tax=Candidatus Dactylopiibacterium carminicum TaxID=857335 RepID=A0A272EU99_9RHOO|nr:hypothetical protein [Candidatus Dactylopiibacterium carminicum]KAF7599738.1 hypothetical protein BGI27_06545 [Candidatus Dactylopiibacterium carminicum]PAS93674.1 MAG: hypothetical protein CGU29_06985 [Candidatus Dactylopiibacterium carminicum]PAS97542.1 MAG: hypothetical protein CGU28_04915 [Candidatus Dactylopiibacterium carminicum]PAS99740.1 MAG: hypothetical protein BSR46_06580 [Candidatus Dactylopiibacterium carminicum]
MARDKVFPPPAGSAYQCTRIQRADLCVDQHPLLFESLRELALESCLEVAGCTLRIGLAASTWQLQQARALLEHFQLAPARVFDPNHAAHPEDHAVALALSVGPVRSSQPRARGVIALHRDSTHGLHLDRRHRASLDRLRACGARLAEVEQLVFDRSAHLTPLLPPMIQVLAESVSTWGITDIVTECPRQHASFYCTQFGFRRVRDASCHSSHVLLHLPELRIQKLQSLMRTN